MTLEERFWAKVDKQGPDECWEWRSSLNSKGYGRISMGKTDQMFAHRLSYELHFGPIPDGLLVCHRCDNPPCVNPSHLFTGTRSDNMLDCSQKGRHGARQHPERLSRGINRPAAKLTNAAVVEIRKASGTHREIASRFSISHGVVGRIRRRKIWTHVPEEQP